MDNKEIPKHRKKSKKKTPRKSNHKHEYKLVEKKEWVIEGWFTHIEVCMICGKVNNKLRIDDDYMR
jgi:hypothetical protein